MQLADSLPCDREVGTGETETPKGAGKSMRQALKAASFSDALLPSLACAFLKATQAPAMSLVTTSFSAVAEKRPPGLVPR